MFNGTKALHTFCNLFILWHAMYFQYLIFLETISHYIHIYIQLKFFTWKNPYQKNIPFRNLMENIPGYILRYAIFIFFVLKEFLYVLYRFCSDKGQCLPVGATLSLISFSCIVFCCCLFETLNEKHLLHDNQGFLETVKWKQFQQIGPVWIM